MLPPALTRRPATGHQGWCAGKVASGGLRRYTAPRLFEMPCGTKDFSLFERQPRQGAALAQTNTSGDLPPVPGAVTLPNGGKDIPAPGQGTTDLSLASTDGGGEAKSKRADMLEKMKAAEGTPYGHGKQEPGAKGQLDCSGFVKWGLGLEGIQLKLGPGTSGATQIIGAAGVSQVTSAQPGDLAYWSKPFAHIMVVTSPGMVYGASRPGITIQERPEKYFGTPTYYRVGALDAPR